MRFRLKRTCGGCPETYDVFYDGVAVGNMRLRYGGFVVRYMGQEVYSAMPEGADQFKDGERDHFLNLGCAAIQKRMAESPTELLFEVG